MQKNQQAKMCVAVQMSDEVDPVQGHAVLDELDIPRMLFGRVLSLSERVAYLRGRLESHEVFNRYIVPVHPLARYVRAS